MTGQFRLKHGKGFTLAELLIALLIIAEIATFAIPKVLSSQANAQRKAVLKEVISMVNAVQYQGWQMGEITQSESKDYFFSHINAVKVCTSNSSTEGCWPQAYGISVNSENLEPGFLLHNGASLSGFISTGTNTNMIAIDWNGPAGPNLEGEDQLGLHMCYSASGCPLYAITYRPGRLMPQPGASETLYNSLFE